MTEPHHEAESRGSDAGLYEATGPRTRWAAIIWGAAFVLAAFTGFAATVLPGGLSVAAEVLSTVSRGTFASYALLLAGVLAMLVGLVVIARRAQRSAAARRSRQSP